MFRKLRFIVANKDAPMNAEVNVNNTCVLPTTTYGLEIKDECLYICNAHSAVQRGRWLIPEYLFQQSQKGIAITDVQKVLESLYGTLLSDMRLNKSLTDEPVGSLHLDNGKIQILSRGLIPNGMEIQAPVRD